MDANLIYDAYHELSQNEAFEVFEHNNVDIEDIADCLGHDVSKQYLQWIYEQLK